MSVCVCVCVHIEDQYLLFHTRELGEKTCTVFPFCVIKWENAQLGILPLPPQPSQPPTNNKNYLCREEFAVFVI